MREGWVREEGGMNEKGREREGQGGREAGVNEKGRQGVRWVSDRGRDGSENWS